MNYSINQSSEGFNPTRFFLAHRCFLRLFVLMVFRILSSPSMDHRGSDACPIPTGIHPPSVFFFPGGGIGTCQGVLSDHSYQRTTSKGGGYLNLCKKIHEGRPFFLSPRWIERRQPLHSCVPKHVSCLPACFSDFRRTSPLERVLQVVSFARVAFCRNPKNKSPISDLSGGGARTPNVGLYKRGPQIHGPLIYKQPVAYKQVSMFWI